MDIRNTIRTGQEKTRDLRKRIGRFSGLLLLFYLCVIIYFALFSDTLGRNVSYIDYQYNLTPFQEIRRFITYRDAVPLPIFVLNLLGNLLIFAPLGFLLPLIRMKKTGPFRVLFYAALLSLGIELLQLVTKVGVFDVDDLILNTGGSLIGYVVYWITRPFMRLQFKYLEEKQDASN